MNNLIIPDLPANLNRALTIPNKIVASTSDIVEVNKALNFLSSATRPSEMVGIVGPLYPSLQQIDDLFATSIREYKRNLINASARDVSRPDLPVAYPKIFAAAKGCENIVRNYTPDVPVIREVALPFLAIFGVIWGLYYKEDLIKQHKEENKSHNRKNWAIHLSIQEEKRLSDSIKLIKVRAQALADDIVSDANQSGMVDHRAIEEIQQIDRMLQGLSGSCLKVKQNRVLVDASQFLLQYV